MAGVLAGVRVLEFSQIIAGPICGVILSDLGADVIKVEPPTGDPIRRQGGVVPGESKGFQAFNRGKRSVAVDLQTGRGRDLIRRLVSTSDVVITNYRVGVPERLGIDYETLRATQPSLVYWHGTAFGSRGPEAHRSGSDLVAQAYAGLLAGDEKVDEWGAPVRITAAPFADYMTGVAGAVAVCAALHHRTQTGEGQKVESSLLQSALFMQTPSVSREPVTDAVIRDPMVQEVNEVKTSGGSYTDILAARARSSRFAGAYSIFYGGYQASDGPLVLGALTKANRDAIRRLLAIEGEESDRPDYDANAPDSLRKAEEWKAVVRQRIRTKTVDEWLRAFDEAGVPASAVQIPEELADDPQVAAMGLMAELHHDITGVQRMVGPLITLDRTPAKAQFAAPSLGAHTRSLLREIGVDDSAFDELRANGIVA